MIKKGIDEEETFIFVLKDLSYGQFSIQNTLGRR